MTAIKKDELIKLEKKFGLEEDGLSYQHRCSRITAYMKGESWTPPKKKEKQKPTNAVARSWQLSRDHPLFGKRILITPLMTPDAKRNIAFDEPLGPEIVVRDYNAGEAIYGAAEDVERMVGDYEILRVDKSKQVIAKTTFPKIGTEISWRLGVELCPGVRGKDNKKGYIWSFPTSLVQVGDTMIQLYGLKTLIRQVAPELEAQFSGKPIMDYIDGVTLAASIPQTHTLIKKYLREEAMAAKAGLGGFGGII